MTTGRINQVADGPTCGARQPRSLGCSGAEGHHRSRPALARRLGYSSFSCEAVLHGQRWARALHRSRAPLPFQFSLLPAPVLLGSRRAQMTPWSRLFRGSSRLCWRLAGADKDGGQQTTDRHRANTDRPRLARRPNINQRFQPTNRTSFPANAQHRPNASRVATTLDAQPRGPGALLGCLTITQMATTSTIVFCSELGLGEEQNNNRRPFKRNEPVRHSQPPDEHCSAPTEEEHIARRHAQFTHHRSVASLFSLHPPSYIPVDNSSVNGEGFAQN